ncbi:MAG: polyprenol monophosphomannose synthase [FCB group bacterium]|nr:polyprenol monophosphomannose synthase [FCB group bacterium]
MKTVAISPTYNESKNIRELIEQIRTNGGNPDILIVDDNSPDGTGKIVRALMEHDDHLFLIEREGKLGLGTAYCTGFRWALENGYDRIVQIDADLSHNPADIPRLVEASKEYDLVIGSRYINGVNVVNWPLSRLILSSLANVYARGITGMPVTDATGGFKCFNRRVLENIELEKVSSEGYSFQIEVNFRAWVKGYSIKEISIVFNDRTVGESKMSKKIILEAIKMVPALKLRKIFKRL